MKRKRQTNSEEATNGSQTLNADSKFLEEGEQTKRRMPQMMVGKPYNSFIEIWEEQFSPRKGGTIKKIDKTHVR